MRHSLAADGGHDQDKTGRLHGPAASFAFFMTSFRPLWIHFDKGKGGGKGEDELRGFYDFCMTSIVAGRLH